MSAYENASIDNRAYAVGMQSAARCPEPVRRPEADAALDRLSDRMANLEGVLAELATRLQPVLRTTPGTDSKGSAVPAYNSVLAGRIGSSADRAEYLTSAIRDILDRLEI